MASMCRILHLNYYLPLRMETKIFQRRKVVYEKPVFPGYIFGDFNQESRHELFKTKNVVRFIETDNEQKLLYELTQVRNALAIDPSLSARAALKKGVRVRIKTGPFMGLEGIVSSIRNARFVRLNVDIIGQAVSVEIENALIELAD